MRELIDFINKKSNNKFKDLLFFGAEYEKESKNLTVMFNVIENYDNIKSEKKELKEYIKQYVGLDINYSVKIKNIKFDKEICLKEIKAFFLQKKELSSILNADCIKLKNDESSYIIILPTKREYVSIKLEESIKNYVEDVFSKYGIFSFEIDYQLDGNNECDDVLKKRIEENTQLVTLEEQPKIVFNLEENVLGEVSNVDEVVLANENLECVKNLTVCGIVKYFGVREFTRNEKTKKFVSFKLIDGENKLDCAYFGKDIEKLEQANLEDKEVAVCCDVEERNGKSLKIKDLAIGKIIKPKLKMKQVNEEYYYVKPSKFVELGQANFLVKEDTISKEYLLNNTFVVFDLETTGLDTKTCKIVEIGAVKVVNGKIVEKFETFVNPECKIPPDATKVNNITDDMVKDAPTIEKVVPDFYKFCYGSILVAQNISYDYPIISRFGIDNLYDFNNEQQDTVVLAKKYVKGLANYKLATLCNHFDISLIGAHRALNDTVATAKLFVKLIEKFA